MTAAQRTQLLAALDKACREAMASPWLADLLPSMKRDADAAQWGARTADLAEATGVRVEDVRRVLASAASAGLVTSFQQRARQPIRWWPVGLVATLQAERQRAGAATEFNYTKGGAS